MDTDSHPGRHNKLRLLWLLLAGAAIAVLILGWRVFYHAPAPQTALTGQAGPLPPAVPPPVPDAPANPYLNAGYDELLDRLRDQLSGSPAAVLDALAEIAQTRPELALELAQALARTDSEKATWVQAIVKTWAGHDAQKAWDWVAEPTNQLANTTLVSVVMEGMAKSDPETLIGKVDTILHQENTAGPFAQRSSVYLGLQSLIDSGNVELAQAAVESWAKDPNNLNIGAGAYDIVALALDKKGPENAAAWLLTMPDSDDRKSAISTFASGWGQNDPVAAINWAQQTLSPQQGQSDVLGRVFNEWIQSDAATATNWLDNYVAHTPDSVEGDTMIGSLVLFSPFVKNDPAEAMKLASSISNPQTQDIYEEQIVQSWARSDASAALNYLETTPTMNPKEKELLTQKIRETESPMPGEQ